jgi:hypothetical protein
LDEEEVIAWQDVLDEIAAGRPGNARCPFCGTTPMRVERLSESMGDPVAGAASDDLHGPMRVVCSKCGKYIEGTFGGY